MKVKRLEIQGFKSFKDKTVLHFDDGVTGIVGPNGCGKSNIVDSFFWVMGEQSTKHLRGTTSQDLIFSGSEKYPSGGMAEVTMVLSTGAPTEAELPSGATARDLPAHMRFPEISITRRLYRSGESEYLINGQTCRLKDIHELFMDTGAGPKAYSIIEQGQISKIVASKPEDRRVLVEEAAGITKFKARKKESLRKIEATQGNLSRINDIVTEIERQLASLERQAAKARQYKKHKEDLKDKELFVGRKRLWTLQNKISEISTLVSQSQGDESSQRMALDQAQLRAETLKITEAEANRSADDALNSLQVMQRELSQLQTKLELHKRSIQEVHNASESLESERDDLTGRVANIQQSIVTLQEESQAQNAIFSNAEETLATHQKSLDAARTNADEIGKTLEVEKKDLMTTYVKQTEFSNQVHGLEARVDGLSVRINQLSARLSERTLDADILREKEQALSSERTELSTKAASSLEALTQAKTRLTGLEQELVTVRAQEQDARAERTKAESRRSALSQLMESHEGFRLDVKNMLKDQSFSEGLSGAFADHLEAHPGYEYALESALKDFFESVFVQDTDRAKTLLSRLKEENKGRITFWAMDLLAEKAAAFSKTTTGWAAPGTSLVDVIRLNHSTSERLMPFFARYRVVDSLDDALAHCATSPTEVIFVTKEGDLVDGMGRISGGSTRSLEGGILARKAELAKLTEALQLLVSEHDVLVERLAHITTELSTLKPLVETLSAESKDAEVRLTVVDRDWSAAQSQLQALDREIAAETEERQNTEDERRTLWERLDGIRQELINLETAHKSRQADIDSKTSDFNRAMERCAELQAGLIQLKVDFASAQEKYRYAQEKLTNLQREYQSSSARLAEINSILNRKLDEKDDLQTELMTLEESVVNAVENVTTQEVALRTNKSALESARQELNTVLQSQRDLMKELDASTGALNRAQLDLERAQIEFQSLMQGLFERYGLDESAIAYDAAFDDLSAEDEAAMLDEVEQLKEKIRRLGEVNIMAVDEYDEQKRRHDFLVEQREDLLKSIQDLEKAIERINITSEERFKRAFEEINTRFQKIFPLVFGGGTARLELTNPEDYVETGVEIMAEPPGKKIGSIQLMSGGEKALTAVALIFSIFLIKPSPFCVLDEVDAPLDDHNVGKFNMLLKEMAARSQFIIITHNKRTMELNNKLYGVTMEEPGVSKMVSIEMQ